MEDVLRHYETECVFHSVECLRCGKAVLHKELAEHYEAGCSVAGSTARLEKTPWESRALTLGDVTAAFEEMKSLLNDSNNGELLAAIQSQVNRLAEQVRKRESTLAEITHEVGESVRSRVAQVAASTSSATSQREDHFAGLPRDVLQGMQKTSSQDFPRHFIEVYYPSTGSCRLSLTTSLPTTRTWKEMLGNIKYRLSFANFGYKEREAHSMVSQIAVLHTSDAYFTVEGCNCNEYTCVRIKFDGSIGSSCAVPFFYVKVYCWDVARMRLMTCYEHQCAYRQVKETRAHCHYEFRAATTSDTSSCYLTDGNMLFQIEMSRNFT
ncbi:hypothetical protein MRX96_056183 [Rhipicephalus microplus]